MPRSAYKLLTPVARSSATVFASPHSGCDYPEWFVRRSLLNAHAIRSSEDAYVDQLFAVATRYGAPLLVANAPRAFIDLNRSPDELDPALIEGVRRVANNPRVASGLGVIPRVVANGRAIYRGKIRLDEANRRIERFWRPYHARLQSLLSEARQDFGQAILIDCHSMPHEAMDGMVQKGIKRPDIVLGDRFGAAADPEVIDRIEAAFAAQGFTVSRNAPFAGAYVTQHYGRPSRGQHAVQIEIDRALYMDEKTIQPHDGFESFRAALAQVISEIVAIGSPENRLAAE